MSVQAGNDQSTQGQENNSGTSNDQGQNQQRPENTQPNQQQQTAAPYAQYLEQLPESVRPVVEPIFKDWDAGVTRRFGQLHSQFSWAEPWQEIAEQYDPDTVSQSLTLLQALSTDPEGFYKALGETYGLTPAQAQQAVEQGQLNADGNQQQIVDPRLDQIEQMVGSLAETLLSEREQQQNQQEEQAFVQHLQELQQQYGEFDFDYVVTKVAAGATPEQAVQQYRSLLDKQSNNNPGQAAPVVMSGSGGGGVPSTSVNFRELDRKQTQGLVTSLLEARNQQQN